MTTTNFQFSIYNLQKGSTRLSFWNKKSGGFTLVETLVSLVILTTALIPILNLSSSASKVSAIVQDDLIASGLAQEGAEVIHAIRDTNWFNNQAFDSGLGDGVYQVEWNSAPPLTPNGGQALNLISGRYTYSAGTQTKFVRTVTITKINVGELKVVSQVSWQTRTNDSKSITAESHLFNWK